MGPSFRPAYSWQAYPPAGKTGAKCKNSFTKNKTERLDAPKQPPIHTHSTAAPTRVCLFH